MDSPPASYFDTSTWDPRDVLSGGSRMIPVTTPSGEFRVWTKRVGNNPDLKVLLLHGGPGATDELYECFDAWFPGAGHRVLLLRPARLVPQRPARRPVAVGRSPGSSTRSSRSAWRSASTASNFVLLGQSWGGLLAMEYAVHHQEHLKGLVISNMMSSARLYNAYAERRADADDGPGRARARSSGSRPTGTTDDPRYEQLLMEHHYVLHVCRLPARGVARPGHRGRWRTSTRRSTCRCRGPASSAAAARSRTGTAPATWTDIDVPTLVIGATHDTMDPEHMRWMAEQLPQGRYLHCPDGSHLSQFDDPEHYFPGLIDFLKSL